MLGGTRRVTLDVLMACWGIGTWLGVNGLYVQLPLLVERLPEGWALPSSMVLAVQLANIGVLLYGVLRRFSPSRSDAPYIYGLLTVGTLALVVNAFVYDQTLVIGGTDRSFAFLTLTFFAALVGCTSSVLFYPYLRHFRDVYLATYLVGEGLSGFFPSILALIQGVGGEPECIPSADNSTVEAHYPPPLFDTTVFLLLLGALSASSLVSFTTINNYRGFNSEKVDTTAETKEEEVTTEQNSLLTKLWVGVLVMMAMLNALNNGLLPSVQSYSCMPYGTRAYHLSVTLGAMANPVACLAGVWLRPVDSKVLGAMLGVSIVPLCYIVATALLSPVPPLIGTVGGEFLIVLCWVLVSGVISYARMWVYGWARRGGAKGMRACGALGQLGSVIGSGSTFFLVNYTNIFVQPDVCPPITSDGHRCTPAEQQDQTHDKMDVINFIVHYFITKDLHMMTAFICWPPGEISALWRSANEAGLRVTVYSDLHQPPAMMPYARHREAMVVDIQCDGAAYLLQNASSVHAFNYRHVWLLLHNSSYDRTIIEDTLEDYKILPDSDVVWSTSDSLIDLYRLKMNTPYLLLNLGLNWTSSKQELVALWGALPRTAARRKNLRNMSLNATSLITRPELFHDWEDTSTRQFDTFPKLTYWLMRLVEQDLNMRYNLHQVAFYGVWVTDHNGTFDGLMGLVQRGQAEVGFATMFMRFDRMDAVHFIAESYPLTVAIIYRQPSRSSVSNVFLAPFSSGVWIVIGLMALSAALLLMLIKRIRETTHCQSPGLLAFMTFPDTFTFALASMCQQGYHTNPAVSSIRVVMFSTLLSALFLFTAYSAKIVALLQMPSEAIKTIEDLTKSPLTVGVHDSSYKTVYFKESKDPRTQALYRRKIVPHGERAYYGVNEGIALVKSGLFAFQVERSAGYDVITKTFTEREKCSLDQLEAFKLPMSAVPMKKYSGYRELFATRLRWLREVGLMTQLRHKWLVAWPRCDGVSGDFVSIGIKDVWPAIQVLGVGAALSVVILLAELMSHALKSRACECPRLLRRYSVAATTRVAKPWT